MPRRRIVPAAQAALVSFPVAAPAAAPAPAAVAPPEPIAVFAYGSNMLRSQLRSRCPGATGAMPARLLHHRLGFVGYSRGWGGAVATVEPLAGAVVDGVAFWLTAADLARLDAYEGVPTVYQRKLMTVRGWQRKVRAWVYVRTGASPGAPSYRYLAALVAGAVEHGLDPAPIVEAAERCADVWTPPADLPL